MSPVVWPDRSGEEAEARFTEPLASPASTVIRLRDGWARPRQITCDRRAWLLAHSLREHRQTRHRRDGRASAWTPAGAAPAGPVDHHVISLGAARHAGQGDTASYDRSARPGRLGAVTYERQLHGPDRAASVEGRLCLLPASTSSVRAHSAWPN